MNIYITEMQAIDLRDKSLKRFVGQRVEAPTWALAELWCLENAPYLKVIGKLVSEHSLDEDIDYNFKYN